MIKCLIVFCALIISNGVEAQEKKSELEWKSLSEIEGLQKKEPKKIIVDVYADWCYWCKKLEEEISQDSALVTYLSEHFYLLKINPQDNKDLIFQGKSYKRKYFQNDQSLKKRKVNELVVQWLDADFVYPTLVFFDENFDLISNFKGYKQAKELGVIAHFFGSDAYKKVKWSTFVKGNN